MAPVIRSPSSSPSASASPSPPPSTTSPHLIIPQTNCDCGCQAIVEEALLYGENSEEERCKWYRRLDVYLGRCEKLEDALKTLISHWDNLEREYFYLRNSWSDLKVEAVYLQSRVKEQNRLIESLTKHLAYLHEDRDAGPSEIDDQLDLKFPELPIHTDAARAVLNENWLPPPSP